MNMAWETTTDDVYNVLKEHESFKGNERLEHILSQLDTDEIEKAALDGGDRLNEQIAAAYKEIAEQLIGLGVIKKTKNPTYRQLKAFLSTLTEEQLDQNATACVYSQGEAFPITDLAFVTGDDEFNGVLDEGHFILAVKDKPS